MGKGDQRSRRGKIHRGTYGRRRPKKSKTGPKTTSPAIASPPKSSEKTEAE